MSRAASQAAAAEAAKKEEAARKRAARQAAAVIKGDAPPPEVVECTVLPQGHEKISMGEHVGAVGEAHYDEGETFTVALPIAVALFDRGYVNFPGGREASQAAKVARQRHELAEQMAAANLQALLDQP